jgi:hypothetical protein
MKTKTEEKSIEQLAAEGRLSKIFNDEDFWLDAYKAKRIGLKEAVIGLRKIRYIPLKELCKILSVPYEKHYKMLYILRVNRLGKWWNKKLASIKK